MKLFAENIWTIEGGTVSVLGFRYPTRMAIIRLTDGGLFIWSPTELTDEVRAEVTGLGSVHFIVAPNTLHHLFVGQWKDAFPEAQLYGPADLQQKRRGLNFDGALDQLAQPAWDADIDQAVVRGNAITTEIVFFHRASRTVLFTDLLQQYPQGWFSGWRAIVARLDLMTEPQPSVPRKFRLAFTNRSEARRSLEAITAWPADKVLMAHGTPVEADGQAFIRHAFEWL